MAYEVQVMEAPARALAVVKGRATMSVLSQTIRTLFDQVYAELQKGVVKQDGQNVVVYWNDESGNLLEKPEGCPIDVGVQVAAPFENGSGLINSATPAGRVATVAYFGPYDQMSKGYDALMKGCADTGHVLAGPVWEIYGDHEDDPAKLRTDLYCLLK